MAERKQVVRHIDGKKQSFGGPITAGALDAAAVGGAAVAMGFWNLSKMRENSDVPWALGEILLGFIVASGTPEGGLRDFSLGVMAGGLTYLSLRGNLSPSPR